MAVEQARIHIIPKPWGRTDLRPWNAYHDPLAAVGEAWFERADPSAPLPTLLLKLIFTDEPLPIQVHRHEALARSIGLVHGKCEAWYILSATANARIAVGLKQKLNPAQLRACIRDGTIAEQVQWHAARAGDCTFVPPGAIHAIGAGLVIVEIQQRADATLRLFDHGRRPELPIDMAVAVASARQSERHTAPRKLTAARTLLVASPHFVLERMTLAPGVVRELDAAAETWLYILAGAGEVDSIEVEAGNALFLESEPARIEVGAKRLQCLVAYARSVPAPYLLRRANGMRVPEPARVPSRTSLRIESLPACLPGRSCREGAVSPPGRFALVGNSLPRRCGIATFTTDLLQPIEKLSPHERCCIVAMTDDGHAYDQPRAVCLQINDRRLEDYKDAADILTRARCGIVSLRHEFGIFGGEANSHVTALTARLTMPLIATFPTVLERPTPAQRRVLGEIVEASARVIVMAEKGRELLRAVYEVAVGKIEVIAHGTPDGAFVESDGANCSLGDAGGRISTRPTPPITAGRSARSCSGPPISSASA